MAVTDDWTTGLVTRVLVAHPACVRVPPLTFLTDPGGLAHLVAGAGSSTGSSRGSHRLVRPGATAALPARAARRAPGAVRVGVGGPPPQGGAPPVGGLLGKQLSASPHVYWVSAGPAHARTAKVVRGITRNACFVMAVRAAPSSPLPTPRDRRSHLVRVDALLDPERDDEYLALVRFLDIADHGQARRALKQEAYCARNGDGSPGGGGRRRRRFWGRAAGG